jgi:TP901 family phage tail tape measure protein
VLNLANIHSTITYNANLSAAQAQIKALTTQIGALTAAFNTLDKSALTAQRSLAATFAAGVGQAGGFTTSTVKATSAVETFGRQLAANRLTMRQYFREAITGYTRENSLMRRLAEQQVRYQQSMAVPVGGGQAMMMTPQNINAASNAAALASQRFSVFNQLVNGGATAMLNWGKNTQWAGRQLMVGFTVPLMLFTAVASKQFRDLDKELTRFQKVYGSDLGNAISESTNRMREQVKQLAFDISSTYGIAAKETAALAADIAATGAEGEKLISGVQQTTRLAVLGEVDRQEAMKATLSLQSAFRMNTNELAESINFLNAVENQTSATLQDLSTAIPKVGPVVRSLGGDIKDLATLLVAMREGGIPAAEAANALKSGLASLINPTKQASEVAKQFGVDLVGIVEANRGQLMPTIYAMQEALSGLDSFSRSRVIEQIFGKYQFARLTALFDNIGRAGSQTQSVVELASKSSTELAAVANQELRILTESTAVKFQRTLEDLKNSIMPIGQVLTETLIPIFEFIGSGMKTFASFFQALPEPVKNFAKYGVAIAALAGPIIMLVGLFGNLIANGLKFGMMLTRIGARIAGIKTEKFELLTADVMAAKLGVDRLTTSFDTQEKALLRLTGVLSSYEASLRRLTTANPALFVPGAIPGARGQIPIRRQAGSTRPEFVPGSGRGDKIPAMLEPGEFIVNRAATEKYAPVLMEMNRGTLKGFQKGTGEESVSIRPLNKGDSGYSAPSTIRGGGNTSVGEGGARGHIMGVPLIPGTSGGRTTTTGGKRLVIGGQDITWHKQFWLEVTKEENKLTEVLRGSSRNTRLFSQSVREAAVAHGATQEQIDRIQRRIVNGIIQDEQDIVLYKAALQNLASKIETGSVLVTEKPLKSAVTATPRLGPTISNVLAQQTPMVGATTQDFIKLRQYAIEQFKRIENTSGAVAQAARVGLAKFIQSIDVELKALGNIPARLDKSIRDAAKAQSPALRFDKTGKDIVDGLDQGIRSKSKQARQAGVETANEIVAGARAVNGKTGFGMGPGGSMGYFMTGVSPYATGRLSASAFDKKMADISKMAGPSSSLSNRPTASTGPAVSIAGARDQAEGGMRGTGAMNAMFALSMVTSSMSMMSGASQEATAKLGLFTTALMTASMLLMMRTPGAGMPSNFLGLGKAGSALSERAGMQAAQRAVSGTGPAVASNLATRQVMAVRPHAVGGFTKIGGGLATAGGALSMLGGPVGMASAAAITGLVAAYLLVQNAAEEARKRSVAAFEDPIKSAEYFGVAITDVTQQMKDLQTGIEEPIDQGIRDAVKQDYAPLIEKIRFSGASAGARELSLVFNKMIASGLSAESATAAVKAIAIESGQAGGEAFATAYREGLMRSTTPKDVANNLAAQFDPELMARNAEEIRASLDQMNKGLIQDIRGNTAQLLNNSILGFDLKNLPLISSLPLAIASMFSDIDDQFKQSLVTSANYSDSVEQLTANLLENMDVSSTQMIGIVETLFSTFKDAPTESMQAFDKIAETALSFNNVDYDPAPIQEFLNTLDPIASITLSPLIQENEELAFKILKATAAGMDLQDILDAIASNRLDIEINVRVKIAESEQELSQLRKDLSEGIEGDLEGDVERLDTRILNLTNRISNLGEKREESLEKLQENFDGEQKIREDSVEALEDELENKKEVFEEEMKALDDRQDKIEKSSDAYIESLEKNQKADSFYAQQRKTAFGALEKLASGDVFGFLQEREQMSADAQNFSYDQMISDIEERRDLELDAIEEIRDSRQEEQDEYENMMQDRINSIRDVMEMQQEAHDIEMEDEKTRFDTKIENAQKELRNKRTQRKEIQDVIDAVKNDEILSNEELSKVLPPLQAKQYEQKQKEIIKNIFLLEMEKSYEEGVTQNQAVLRSAAAVRPLLEDLMPGSSAQTAEDIMGYLGANPEQTSYYGAPPGVDPSAAARRGNTGGSTGPTAPEPGDDFNPNETWGRARIGEEKVGPNGITYRYMGDGKWTPVAQRASGGPIGFSDGGGGKVTGPGGPKSDVIPAYLSNGEYVIQASSVSKYGKDMMDNINAGKFAGGGPISTSRAASQAKSTYRGALPGPMMFYEGGYISADRAETTAAGNKYLGGVNVKPQYAGGTPGNVYGKKRLRREQNNPYTRGGYMQPGAGGGGRAGSGFNLMFQGIKNSIDQQGIFSTLGSMVSSIAADPASLLPFYGLSSIDQSNQQGKDIASAAALMEILGVIPGVGIGFKGASLLGRSASRRVATSSAMQPLQSGLIPPKPIAISQITSDLRFSLGMGAPRILPQPSKPTAAVPSRDMLLLEWAKSMAVDENQLDNVFGTLVPNSQGGISPGGLVIGRDGVRRYVKGPYDSESGAKSVYLESLIANAYKALNMNVPDVSLLNIGAKERYFPGKNLTPELAAMGLNYFPPGELVTSSTMLDNVKHVSEFFGKNPNRDWADGLTFVESQLDSSMQSRLAREGGIGKAVDTLFGLRDSHIFNYIIKEDESIPLGAPGRLIPYRIDFGSNVFQTPDGRPVTNDPTDPLKILDPRYGSSFGFGKVTGSVYKQQVLRLEEIIGDAGGIGGLIDPIVEKFALQAPQHRLVNPNFLKFVLLERLKAMVEGARGYANGGLVQKFADGGEALTLPNRGLPGKLSLINRNDPNTPANGGFLPGVGTTGVAAAARPTTTTIGAQGGPNGWPWISSYNSGLLDTKKIPGTNVNLTMNKDVLPLFLALASDYNRTIRKIGPGSGGFDPRTDRPESERARSNHPSGTAMDINWSEEGALSNSTDLFNWWKTGKTSAGAPWKPISPQPYKTALSLKNKYKVVDWFGPTSLGGYINGTPDYMHWQISQGGGVVTPQRVAQVIGELGINPDGTFNRPNTYAAGGFISGPGGPRSDMIPAMLSNGEYVVKASSVSKYGKGFMDQINSGSLNPFQGSSMQPRMFADGGMVGPAPMPAFSMPAMADTSVGVNNTNYAGNSSSTRNNTKVKVVINGAGGKGANAIANKVISMINSANNRRNHSRSI